MKIILKNTQRFTVITTLCLFAVTLFVVSGCEKSKVPQDDIYENHEISACGVNDPLQNIEWLREYCESLYDTQYFSGVYIHLYKAIDKNECFFLMVTEIPTMSPSIWDEWKNCAGETIFTMTAESPPDKWELYKEFVETKEYVAELFHFVK